MVTCGLILLARLQSYHNMANFINKICGVTSTGIAKVLSPNYSATNKINSILDNKYSIDFDGSGDYIDASTSADNMSTATGTVCVWAELDGASNNEAIFECSIGTSGNNKIMIKYVSASNLWRGQFKANTGGSVVTKSADYTQENADAISAGWQHFAMTWDTGTADEIKLYVNGSLEDTEATITHFNGTPDRVHLGKAANASHTYHDGQIDNFALWNSVLTAAEITAIYNVRNPDFTAAFTDTAGNTYDSHGDLIQWLRMLENTGTSLADSSGNSNTASITNAAWIANPAF